jgi:hypothetical protein
MRTPAMKPSQADTIDNVVTTVRPNRISEALLREAFLMEETLSAVDLGGMIQAALCRLESCNFMQNDMPALYAHRCGEGRVKRIMRR